MFAEEDPIGLCAQQACLWEATARKPGNVHRYRDFQDTTYLDFALSAAAIAPVLALAPRHSLGQTVIECVRRTRTVTQANTNLGMVLLLAPLAKAWKVPEFPAGVTAVLETLTVEDANLVSAAICLAAPGGLGKMKEGDVRETQSMPLRDLMALAADRDRIARQYTCGFADVFNEVVPLLQEWTGRTNCLEGGIVGAHLLLMARFPDSLIARKRGQAEAREAGERAATVLAAGWPAPRSKGAMAALDAWLRAEGNARNPGTTADLIAAGLFVLQRQGLLVGQRWTEEEGAIAW